MNHNGGLLLLCLVSYETAGNVKTMKQQHNTKRVKFTIFVPKLIFLFNFLIKKKVSYFYIHNFTSK